MTDSEIVVRRLLEYRDGPPERVCAETPDGDGIVGRFYTMGDILEIIMHPKCEFTTYELLTRLAELMDAPSKGTCHNVHEPPSDTTFWPTPHFKCSECGIVHVSMDYVYFCPNCGAKQVN